MTGPEHYREAEKMLIKVGMPNPKDPAGPARWLAEAQVHATLALAAATEQAQLDRIRDLLVDNGGEFDDPHTADAGRLAQIANVVGLVVERDDLGVRRRIIRRSS